MLFETNQNCTGDGICAQVCPVGIIQMIDGKPQPAPNSEARCIACGHCVAVCPHAAMDHTHMKTADCLPIEASQRPGPDQMEHILRMRRSIRNYTNTSVEKEQVMRLIHMARYANTGHNSQSVKWHVTLGREKVKDLIEVTVRWMEWMIKEQPEMAKAMFLVPLVRAWQKGHDGIGRGAPAIISTYSPESDRFAPMSSTIALSYLELAAPSLNLGTCWAGYMNMSAAQSPAMKQAMGLPADSKIHGMVLIGHPQFKYYRLPLRKAPEITWN